MSTTMIKGCDAVDDAVGACLTGIVGEYGKAGLHAGLDEERTDVEEGFAEAADGGIERRDDRGDGDAGDDFRREPTHAEQGLEENAELVGGLFVGGGNAPVSHHVRGFGAVCGREETKYRVGVADIECQ
jgi:hypothetical protein